MTRYRYLPSAREELNEAATFYEMSPSPINAGVQVIGEGDNDHYRSPKEPT